MQAQMHRLPSGYMEQERMFCKEEEDRFYAVDTDEWRELYRPAVLAKRREFRNQWNASNKNTVNE